MRIVVIDYGAGNVFSVSTALKRLGYEAIISKDAEVITSADRVIFPGVGQASAAMSQLRASGLEYVIPELKMPVLGICLGMQLLCHGTEEEDTLGLGVFPIEVKRFVGDFKIPHVGWNTVSNLKTDLFEGVSSDEWMYFVHSYYVPADDFCIAECDYYGRFAAAIRKDNFYGCQFHPEKSARVGEYVLNNFLSP